MTMPITIGDLAQAGVLQVSDGYRTRRDQLATSGYRIIRVADVQNERIRLESPDFVSVAYERQIGTRAAAPGDVLLTTKGTFGRVARVTSLPEKAVYSPQLCFFRVNDVTTVDPRWLLYWLSSEEFLRQASHHKDNTDMAAYVSLSDLRSISITLPVRKTQQAIAEVLGALDDKIAANENARKTSSDLLQEAFKDVISHESHGSEFLEAITVEYGEAFKGEHFVMPGEGRPLIRIRDLKTGAPKTWTLEHRSAEALVKRGDVLVGMDAEFRPTAWVGDEGVLNQRVCRMSNTSMGQAYLREAIKAPLAHIESYKTGTTVSHLNKSDLATAKVIMLSEPRQAAFKARYEGVYNLEVAGAHENQALAALRDTLLPALMSGKLCVRDAEKAVEEVL